MIFVVVIIVESMFAYRFLADLPTDLHKFEIEEDRHIFEELRSVCHFADEFAELKYGLNAHRRSHLAFVFLSSRKILATVNSPVCFTHNDFQPGNILRLKSQPETFTVIDFEYCSYNYR